MFKRYNSDQVTHYHKSSEWLLFICFNLFGLNLCTQLLRTLIRRITPLMRWLDSSEEEEWENSEDGYSSDSSNEDQYEDFYPEEIYVDEQEIQRDLLFNTDVDLLHVITGII